MRNKQAMMLPDKQVVFNTFFNSVVVDRYFRQNSLCALNSFSLHAVAIIFVWSRLCWVLIALDTQVICCA